MRTETLEAMPHCSHLRFSSLLGEPRPAEANVDQALLRGEEGALLLLAEIFSPLQRVCGAIVDVGAVRHRHRRLVTKQESTWIHSRLPNARPNLQAVVVRLVSVEVAAMPVLVRLRRHGDPGIDVVTF